MAKKRKRLVIDRDFDGWAWQWTKGDWKGLFIRALYYSKSDCLEDVGSFDGEGRPVRVKLVVVDGSET